MGRHKSRSQKLLVARNLPPSYHKLPGQEYDVRKSEVIDWLIKRPSIREFLWDHIRQSGHVEYDSETGIWTGVDYDGSDDDI